jgi:HD-like signal output (HDOD) protein
MIHDTSALTPAYAKAAEKLPPLSPACRMVIARPDASIREITEWIDSDPALCAFVLRVANSPFFGMRDGVGSISDAAMIIGRGAVASICSARLLKSLSAGASDIAGEPFWRMSARAACFSAQASTVCRVARESAFCAGLLHGIGSLLPPLLDEPPASILAPEQLGAALARTWHFPADLCSAIALSAAPDASSPLSVAAHFGRTRAAMASPLSCASFAPFDDAPSHARACAGALAAFELLSNTLAAP